MKTVNLSDETYKKLAILKIEREASSFDVLIDFLIGCVQSNEPRRTPVSRAGEGGANPPLGTASVHKENMEAKE